MPHERFYLEDPLETAPTITGAEFHHLAHVLRARVGEEIELTNGHGILAKARIEKMDKTSASLTLLHREKLPRPSPELLMGLSLIRMNRLEWIIEKGTELGADSFYLFPADHSEKDDLSHNQIERLHHLSVAALKQCGRLYLPEIIFVPSLKEVFLPDVPTYFGDTDPSAPHLHLPTPLPPRILFLTGPEKGFSPREHQLLKEKAKGVKLHANILRAETAPLVALSLLSQYTHRE